MTEPFITPPVRNPDGGMTQTMRSGHLAPTGRPAGQHQQLAAADSAIPLPTGQVINVAVNGANPNLTFKEWVARGVVGAIGRAAAFPFRLFGSAIESMVHGIIGIVKTAIIIVLVPTLIWLGFQLQQKMSTQHSIEGGAAQLMHDGRHVVKGIKAGVDDDLAAEASSHQ